MNYKLKMSYLALNDFLIFTFWCIHISYGDKSIFVALGVLYLSIFKKNKQLNIYEHKM